MNKNFWIIILFLLFGIGKSQAQLDGIGTMLKGNFFVGGGFGINIGSINRVEIAPHFGYHFNDVFSAGIGGSYQFYGSRNYGDRYNIFGGRVFARAQPFSFLFLHLEYELLTYKTNVFNPTREYEQVLSENLLIGAGYREYLSEKVSSYFMVMYNANMNIYTPYSNPLFRFGIEVAFPAKKD